MKLPDILHKMDFRKVNGGTIFAKKRKEKVEIKTNCFIFVFVCHFCWLSPADPTAPAAVRSHFTVFIMQTKHRFKSKTIDTAIKKFYYKINL